MWLLLCRVWLCEDLCFDFLFEGDGRSLNFTNLYKILIVIVFLEGLCLCARITFCVF